jgi:hypothetical protein
MENKFKNEMLIEVGGEKILLRPTFENLAAMESKMGGLAYLAFKFGQGIDIESKTVDALKSAKAMPSMTDTAQIIYFNQAEKKFSQEEIFDFCLADGIKVCAQAVLFLVRCSAGNKLLAEPSERQKKSS